MNKISTDLTMTWFAHSFQTALMPVEIWNIITWIAFFFKLASLAFIVPILGLIIFDFCLWVWRLNQPHHQDASQLKPISRRATAQNSNLATSINGVGSTTARSTNPPTSQRRPIYSGHTGD